jgi:ABC-type phosphate transport system auxiliary subunit
VDTDEPHSALDLLQAIYRNHDVPLPTRMRAAEMCLPFESPKLSAIATGMMSGKDFATLLERAILRSQLGKPLRLIEGSRVESDGQRP